MKKTFTFFVLIFLAAAIYAQVEPTDTDADGFRNVSTLENLKWMTENSSSWGDKFKLDNNIDASATSAWTEYSDISGFKPIATGYLDKFTGTFDGNGFKITGLYIHSEMNGTMPALFCKTEDATIENLTLENCDIFSTKAGAAALIGTCKTTTVNNCKSSGTINGDEYIGGLIAKTDNATISNCMSSVNLPGTQNYAGGLIAYLYNNSEVTDSYATGDVSGNDNVGGFIGTCYNSSATNCYSTGAVTSDSKYTGGFVGYVYQSTIINSYSTSSVILTGEASENAGGFVGANMSGSISLCYAMGEVSTEDSEVGGFVGTNNGSIEKSYATGKVTGNKVVGGFVGANEQGAAIIKDCYSRGDVHATVEGHQYVGGFAGENTVKAQLINCYSTGKVTAVNTRYTDIGGFAGMNNDDYPADYKGIITNSYWDITTSELASSKGAEGKTTSEMKTASTFNSWDFSSIWSIDPNKNDGYPHLANYITAVRNVVSNIEFSIYPNPASQFIKINNELKISVIQIIDINGKSVKQINNFESASIDISELNSGIYLLTVKTDKGTGVKRFIKE
ncbi:MAG: T9SS type A sorting domain-containing protein [Paludibacter sp.]|nr:T9SS type A sorting domain-containing protein [Paludibacter sp.]